MSTMIKSYLSNYSQVEKKCWPGILLTFMNDASSGACFFLTIYFVKILHFNITSATIILSFYGLGTVLGGITGGKLSDVINPNTVSLFSLTLKSIAFFLLIKIETFYLLSCVVFFIGVSTYGFKTSNNLWVLHIVKDCEIKRLQILNILYIASNLGIGLSAIVITVIEQFGFQYIFLLSGLFALVSAFYLLLNKDNKQQNFILSKNLQTQKISDQKTKTINKNNIIMPVIIGSVFLVSMIIAQLSTTYPVFINKIYPQYGIKGVSLLLILNISLIFLFQSYIVNLFRDINKLLMSGIGPLLIGLGFTTLNFYNLYIFAIISCVIYTLGEIIFYSVSQLVCYQCGAKMKKGYSLGLFQMSFALGVVTGPSFGGLIYHNLGSKILWDACGITGLICLLFCYYYKKYY